MIIQGDEQFQLCKNSPLEFFKKCKPDFDINMFNQEVLNLSLNNRIFIENDRQKGTSTSLVLMIIHKLIFSEDPTTIFISCPNKSMERFFIDKIKNLISNACKQFLYIGKYDFTYNRSNNSITFLNNNVTIIPEDFLNKVRGMSKNIVIVLDEYHMIPKTKIDNINNGINYLKSMTNLSILYGN
jgi:hypothetical protein